MGGAQLSATKATSAGRDNGPLSDVFCDNIGRWRPKACLAEIDYSGQVPGWEDDSESGVDAADVGDQPGIPVASSAKTTFSGGPDGRHPVTVSKRCRFPTPADELAFRQVTRVGNPRRKSMSANPPFR